MTFTNRDMDEMVTVLSKHLKRRDIIGYAAARNFRKLGEAMTEYSNIKNDLIEKYGEPVMDEDGGPTGEISLSFQSPKFADFLRDIEPFASIEHDVDLMTLDYEKAIGLLTGEEILELDFIFSD